MTVAELNKLTATQAAKQIQAGTLSAEELTAAYLERSKKLNPELNVYLEVFANAEEQAKNIDQKIKAGEMVGPLAGVPVAVKDNILIKGQIASGASKILANYRASYEATVIKKIKTAGAIILGRTNMDEFAMGGSTENSAFGPTKNPVVPGAVPGGSSGGSAAAVAADLALAALGSDTGGSIRQPASFCGVVGLKPTYGSVSRFGLMAMASSLDQIGPITKTVTDAELIFNVIKGPDELDSTSFSPLTSHLSPPKIVGVPYDFTNEVKDPSVAKNFAASLDKLKNLGYEIKEVKLPHLKYALAVYYIIMPAEASTNLARYDGLRYGAHQDGENLLADYLTTRGMGFGPEVRRRIMLGTYVLSAGYYDAYYTQAVAVKNLIRADYTKAFNEVDLIATPTTPSGAFGLGEKINGPLQMYLEDIFTVPINLAGLPAISLPSGGDDKNRPLGLQLVAPRFGEERLFAVGKKFEQNK